MNKLTPKQIKALMKQMEKAIKNTSIADLQKELCDADGILKENQGDARLLSLKKKIQDIRRQRHGR